MEKAILVFVNSNNSFARATVAHVLKGEGGLEFGIVKSPSREVVCYLVSSVDEQIAQSIEFLRVIQNTATFFVPTALLERVEQKREEKYDLFPTDKIQAIDPKAITILAKGEAEPGAIDLVQVILNEIEQNGESRFARLANMAILHEIHRRFSPA